MYEALISHLRECAKTDKSENTFKEAADAIEELSAHYCPHMIRNVHDRGDDSLCRVLGAEPPKEEAND